MQEAGILNGVKVLDYSQFYAGPVAAALLGDMGADVIAIESTTQPDPTRTLPTLGHDNPSFLLEDGRNLWHEATYRGKRSIAIDVDSTDGQDIIHRLAAASDVFSTNRRAASLSKRRLDSQALHGTNPDIIYSQISGYGPSGPLRESGAFDFVIQGYSGILAALGGGELAESAPATLLLDQLTGVLSAQAIVGALFHRLRTGEAQDVDTSLLGTALTAFYFDALLALEYGQNLTRHERQRPGNPFRNFYRCSDGLWIILTHSPAERYWKRLARMLGLKDEDEAYVDSNKLVEDLDHIFAQKTREQWLELAEEHDLIFAPVLTFSEAVSTEQVRSNYVNRIALGGRDQLYPGYASTYSATRVYPRGPAPNMGQHTTEILHDIAGYSMPEISAFREQGTVA